MRVDRGSEEGTALGEFAVSGADAFVWRSGRAEIILSRADESWTVVYTSTGRLLGPRQILYQGKHRDPTYAAWDVMARVVLASRDEDEGLRAGRSAAQWIKAQRRRQSQRPAAGPAGGAR
jgi:hypothetical protein